MNFKDQTRELTESNYVIQNLIDSGWMDENVVIVACGPEYSSRLAQLVNHKTSYLNKNTPYEQINLALPKTGENQVWCYDERAYLNFDKYLFNWADKHSIFNETKFLFITNTIFTGKHLNKVRLVMRNKADIKFLSLNYCIDSILKPDFFWKSFIPDNAPVFFWENKTNHDTE